MRNQNQYIETTSLYIKKIGEEGFYTGYKGITLIYFNYCNFKIAYDMYDVYERAVYAVIQIYCRMIHLSSLQMVI